MTMKIMIQALNRIENKLDDVMKSSAAHAQHLKNINGNIDRNIKDIEKNRCAIAQTRKYIYMGIGGITTVSILITLVSLVI